MTSPASRNATWDGDRQSFDAGDSRADRLLTSRKAMLIKIGAKIVSHSRHVACQMAGGHVQKQESN
jgi:hypothetical protein